MFAQELINASDRLTARSQISDALQWIPPESEALTVISKPYWIPETPPPPREQNSFVQDAYERTIRGAFRGRTRRVVSNQVVDLYVEAASRFRMEKQGGDHGIMADRVYVLIFRKPVGDIMQDLCRVLKRDGAKLYEVAEKPVLQYVQVNRIYPDTSRMYWLAVPRPNVIVLTNRQEFINRVYQKLPSGTPEAFSNQLKEWQYISPGANVWGVRHLRDEIGDRDISDPRVMAADQWNLGRTTGFVFEIDSKARHARSVWLSCDDLVKAEVSSMFKHWVPGTGNEVDNEVNDTFSISIDWPIGAEGHRTHAMFADWITWFLGYAAVI
ncbi:MAG: hypothetical protein HQ518_15620 [Rhodopirellula sp.]|nr:hypothetical protein [Rhodopirellula sp.]